MLEVVLMKLRLWSLLVLPATGFLFGQILQLILRTKDSCRTESLTVHAISMIFMIAMFNDILLNPEKMRDVKDKALFLCLAYLFVLGTVLGVITHF